MTNKEAVAAAMALEGTNKEQGCRSMSAAHYRLAAALNDVAALLHRRQRFHEAVPYYTEAQRTQMASFEFAMQTGGSPQGLMETQEISNRTRKILNEKGQLLASQEFVESAQNSNTSTSFGLFYHQGETLPNQGEMNAPLEDFPEPLLLRVDDVFLSSSDSKNKCESSMLALKLNDDQQNRETSVVLFNLGLCYYEMGMKIDLAIELFQLSSRAVANTSEKVMEAMILNHIAQTCHQKGNTAKAMPMLIEAFKLEQEVLKSQKQRSSMLSKSCLDVSVDQCTAKTLSLMALIHFQNKNYDDALKLCKKVLIVQTQSLGLDSIQVAVTLYNIGLTLQQKGQMQAALEHCRWFIEKILNSDSQGNSKIYAHPQVAKAFQVLGALYVDCGFITEGVHVLACSLDVWHMVPDPNVEAYLGAALFQLGQVLHDIGRNEEAMKTYQEALSIFSALNNSNVSHDEVIIMILMNIAHVQEDSGDLNNAFETFEEVLERARVVLGDNDKFVAIVLAIIGCISLEMCETEDAIANFADAKRILMSIDRGERDVRERDPTAMSSERLQQQIQTENKYKISCWFEIINVQTTAAAAA